MIYLTNWKRTRERSMKSSFGLWSASPLLYWFSVACSIISTLWKLMNLKRSVLRGLWLRKEQNTCKNVPFHFDAFSRFWIRCDSTGSYCNRRKSSHRIHSAHQRFTLPTARNAINATLIFAANLPAHGRIFEASFQILFYFNCFLEWITFWWFNQNRSNVANIGRSLGSPSASGPSHSYPTCAHLSHISHPLPVIISIRMRFDILILVLTCLLLSVVDVKAQIGEVQPCAGLLSELEGNNVLVRTNGSLITFYVPNYPGGPYNETAVQYLYIPYLHEMNRTGTLCARNTDPSVVVFPWTGCSCSLQKENEAANGVNKTATSITIADCPSPFSNVVTTLLISVTNVTTETFFNNTMPYSSASNFSYTNPYVNMHLGGHKPRKAFRSRALAWLIHSLEFLRVLASDLCSNTPFPSLLCAHNCLLSVSRCLAL